MSQPPIDQPPEPPEPLRGSPADTSWLFRLFAQLRAGRITPRQWFQKVRVWNKQHFPGRRGRRNDE